MEFGALLRALRSELPRSSASNDCRLPAARLPPRSSGAPSCMPPTLTGRDRPRPAGGCCPRWRSPLVYAAPVARPPAGYGRAGVLGTFRSAHCGTQCCVNCMTRFSSQPMRGSMVLHEQVAPIVDIHRAGQGVIGQQVGQHGLAQAGAFAHARAQLAGHVAIAVVQVDLDRAIARVGLPDLAQRAVLGPLLPAAVAALCGDVTERVVAGLARLAGVEVQGISITRPAAS